MKEDPVIALLFLKALPVSPTNAKASDGPGQQHSWKSSWRCWSE